MTRLFVPLSVVFAMASAAHAQTYSRSNTYIDSNGNTVTNRVDIPPSVAGTIARQGVNGGSPPGSVPIYNGSVPIHQTPNLNNPFPNTNNNLRRRNGNNDGYNNNPNNGGYGYNYGNNGGYNYNYGNYGGYGYNGGGYGYPAPYPYAYPPQSYFVPGQTIPLKNSGLGWAPGPSITSVPQIVTAPGVPAYGYPVAPGYGYPVPNYGYGYPVPNYGYAVPGYGYGYSSNTTITNGGFSYNRGGISVRAGSTTIQSY